MSMAEEKHKVAVMIANQLVRRFSPGVETPVTPGSVEHAYWLGAYDATLDDLMKEENE